MARARIPIDRDALAEFCRRWGVKRLWLFGSSLTDEFRESGPDASDVDLLAEIDPESPTSYWDWSEMTGELEAIFKRRVDLVTPSVLENPFRRESILACRELLYAA